MKADDPSPSGDRLKVAVLDTGIDINHPDFDGESRLKNRRSWVESSAEVDKSGHGTHIVSTILALTQNVDVYIAKISEGNTLETSKHIAEAIRVVHEEWDVDIISLSFGFPRGSREIQDEIEKALHHRKILFAAASNDGSNTARAYPANQDGVICVHSADGHGNASSFNPTALNGKDNFCVLGENIEAAWPSNTPNQLGGTRRLSGTSFATPVAVSIAALMIGFVSQNKPEHVGWLHPLKGPAGIKAIFHALSERRTGLYDLVNPIKAFGGNTEPEKQKLLMDIQAELDK
ncbi:5a998593-682c-4a12-938d-bc56394e45c7 [Thermothielavioides terrestris]|uniref:5a998593-682c-4a12-938d-bc56394e45c7 n=1 Tax=Thermothielavioides terrestris TaxID=2587410 RepID=A0A3S4F3C5_9PEZI|nr:5a998593-682c-4a12-938d-bc56394e45c7 [Thermothielavioides terrestris]